TSRPWRRSALRAHPWRGRLSVTRNRVVLALTGRGGRPPSTFDGLENASALRQFVLGRGTEPPAARRELDLGKLLLAVVVKNDLCAFRPEYLLDSRLQNPRVGNEVINFDP